MIEERIEGQEASLFVVSDGDNYQLVGTAQDHKRAFDGNKAQTREEWELFHQLQI